MRSGSLQRIRFPTVLTSNDNSGARLRIRIVPLDPSLHDRKSFQCGNDAVDRYLRTTAAQATRYYTAANSGAVAVITDPAEDSAAAFYARYGFATLHEAPFHRMLLPMKTIASALSRA